MADSGGGDGDDEAAARPPERARRSSSKLLALPDVRVESDMSAFSSGRSSRARSSAAAAAAAAGGEAAAAAARRASAAARAAPRRSVFAPPSDAPSSGRATLGSDASSSRLSYSSAGGDALPSYLRVGSGAGGGGGGGDDMAALLPDRTAPGEVVVDDEAGARSMRLFAALLKACGMVPAVAWRPGGASHASELLGMLLGALWPVTLAAVMLLRVARDVSGVATGPANERYVYASWTFANLVPPLCQAGGALLCVRWRVLGEVSTSLLWLNRSLTSSQARLDRIVRQYNRYVRRVARFHVLLAVTLLGVPWLLFNARRLAGHMEQLSLPWDRDAHAALGAAYPFLFAVSDLFFFLQPTVVIVLASFVMHLLRRRVKRMRDTWRRMVPTEEDAERRVAMRWAEQHVLATRTADKWYLAGGTFGTRASACACVERAFYRLFYCRDADAGADDEEAAADAAADALDQPLHAGTDADVIAAARESSNDPFDSDGSFSSDDDGDGDGGHAVEDARLAEQGLEWRNNQRHRLEARRARAEPSPLLQRMVSGGRGDLLRVVAAQQQAQLELEEEEDFVFDESAARAAGGGGDGGGDGTGNGARGPATAAEYVEHLRSTFGSRLAEGDLIYARVRRRFASVLVPTVALWALWAVGLAVSLVATDYRRPRLAMFVSVTFLPLLLFSLLHAITEKYKRHRRKLEVELKADASENSWLQRNKTFTFGLWTRSSVSLLSIFGVYSSLIVYTLVSLCVTMPLVALRLALQYPACVHLCGKRRGMSGGLGYASDCSEGLNFARYLELAVCVQGGSMLLSYLQLRFVCGHAPTAHLRRVYGVALAVGVPLTLLLMVLAGPDRVPLWVTVPQFLMVLALYVYGARSMAPRVCTASNVEKPRFARAFLVVTLVPLLVHLVVLTVVIPVYLRADDDERSVVAIAFPMCTALLYVALAHYTTPIRSPQELLLQRVSKLKDFSPHVFFVGGDPLTDPRAMERKSTIESQSRASSAAAPPPMPPIEEGLELQGGGGGDGLRERLVGAEAPSAAVLAPPGGGDGASDTLATLAEVRADQERQLGGRIANDRADRLYLGPLSRAVLLISAKAWLELYARIFLLSLRSLSEQAVAVVIFAAAEVAWRTLSPTGRYLWARVQLVLCGQACRGRRAREMAEEKSDAFRNSVFGARVVAAGMFISVFSIVYALGATFLIGWHFDGDQFESRRMSTRFFFGSLCIQLLGAIASDVLALKLEESYLERPILAQWHCYKRQFFLVFLPFAVLGVFIFLPEFVLLAIEPPPCKV